MRRLRLLGIALIVAPLVGVTVTGCASPVGSEHCGRKLPPVWDAPVMASADTAATPVGAVVSVKDGGPASGDCETQPEVWAGLYGWH